jgi:ubiquinone biosynthesis protein COQ4
MIRFLFELRFDYMEASQPAPVMSQNPFLDRLKRLRRIPSVAHALFLLARGFLRLARAKAENDINAVRGAFDMGDAEFKLNLYEVPKDHLESDPATRALADQFYGSATRFSLELLLRCPYGSLGWALKRCTFDRGLDPEFYRMCRHEDLRTRRGWFSFRARQIHDLLHVVTGYPTTHTGELATFAFLGANCKAYSAYLIAVAGVLGQLIRRKEKLGLMNRLFAQAWLSGESIPPLLGIRFEELLHLPLYDVRAQLGIPRYGFGDTMFPPSKLYGYSFRQLDATDGIIAESVLALPGLEHV